MKNTFKALFTAGLLSAGIGFGAGFSILEQSVPGMGRSLAGMSADTTDPASLYFNPAASGWFEHAEISIGNHMLHTKCQFEDHGSSPELGGDESGDQGGWVAIPNLYYVQPLTANVVFGVGMSATSGTRTDYNPHWIGRYTATETEITVMDFTLSLAWKIRDDFSIGIGLVTEYAKATLAQMVDLSPYGLRNNQMKIKGDGVGFGFSAGMLFEPLAGTKIGLGYRSRMKIDLDLSARVRNANALKSYGIRVKSDGDAELNLPSMVNFGIVQDIGENWKIMADIRWTEWSVMDELTVKFDKPVLGQKSSTQEMKWTNNWTFALGGEYKVNDKLTLRGGVAYDECTNRDEYRNTKLPDADRYWISAGLGYQLTEHLRCDFSYMHLFFEHVNYRQPAQKQGGDYYIQGKEIANADIFSFGLTYTF